MVEPKHNITLLASVANAGRGVPPQNSSEFAKIYMKELGDKIEYYAIKVWGESLFPKINHGDYVIFTRFVSDDEDGLWRGMTLSVVHTVNYGWMIKNSTLLKGEDGLPQKAILSSINPNQQQFKPFEIDLDEERAEFHKYITFMSEEEFFRKSIFV